MHDFDGRVHWHEPTQGKRAGHGKFGQPMSDYDRFMEEDGIPVFRGVGLRSVKDLELQDWPRMGGRGHYIQLHGTEGKWGSYVVEVPGGGALNPEKHLYEEIYLVVEGRGTTEVWLEEGGNPACLRMAGGLAVLDPGERDAPHRQRDAQARAPDRRARPRRT